MKKFASLVAAGAMLLSTVGVAFAGGWSWGGVDQFSFTKSTTGAYSNSGTNKQFGSGFQMMSTGDSGAFSESLTAGNVNLGGHSVDQFAGTTSRTSAGATSGSNSQMSFGHHSFQSMGTGLSQSEAGSITVSNLNVSMW
jgi:GH43 family beta-xylosidase